MTNSRHQSEYDLEEYMAYFDDDEDYGENLPNPYWSLVLVVIILGIIVYAMTGCSAQGSHNANLDFHFLDFKRRGR